MFYYLSLLRYHFCPLNIFKYITFRAGMAAVTTFLICIIIGPWFMRKVRQWDLGEKPVTGAGRSAHRTHAPHFQTSAVAPFSASAGFEARLASASSAMAS